MQKNKHCKRKTKRRQLYYPLAKIEQESTPLNRDIIQYTLFTDSVFLKVLIISQNGLNVSSPLFSSFSSLSFATILKTKQQPLYLREQKEHQYFLHYASKWTQNISQKEMTHSHKHNPKQNKPQNQKTTINTKTQKTFKIHLRLDIN